MLVHPETEGDAETDAMQTLAQQIAALRSEKVALQEQLTSTRSELADDKQTIVVLKEQLTASASTRSENVALQEQLTSMRSELADSVTREQVVTDRLSFFVRMDKDEKNMAERIAKLKVELADLQTSASSASQGALIASAEITAQAASPAQVRHTPVDCAVLEINPTKSAQAALDFKMRLGLRIAAGPEAFFALADTTQDDILTPQDWLEACKSSLGNVDETLCRSLFNEMDLDKDGRVSKGEFIAMRNSIRLFVTDAKCQEMLIEVLAGLVVENWKIGGEDDKYVAERTTEVLTELSVDELRKEVAAVLPRRLKEHGDEVKREREERKKKLAVLQVEEGEGKFGQLPTAAYGDKGDFHKGLEVLGQPHSNTLEELMRECQKCKDSLDNFTAWNSGPNETNSSKELDFVMDPFEITEGWQEQDPEYWKPKHDYGGNRIPMRLEVYMHVLSASSEVESAMRFGNYKDAHMRDKGDPLWLHAKEVDKIKVVLCRFIKSQLTGQSLINALDKGKDVNTPAPLSLSKADVRAAKIIKALSKGLSEGGDGSASTCTFGFVLQTVLHEAAATEWELEALLDHFHALFASKPINESEVIAGRAYTGPLYFKMNGSLRFASKKFGNQEHLKGNSYTNLIYACASLLRKFSEISIIPPGRMVYRGMHGVDLPEAFKVCKEGGGRGGVDFGFLSTSTNEMVAVSYIGGKAMPVLFQFDVGDIDRGASLSFLSQYPNEDEVLIPPLSYLEVIGDPFFKHTVKGEVTVYPARINCNLKSQTIEEIKGHRQKEILAMLPYLDGALRRDMAVLVEALAADFREKAEEKKLDELTAQILRDFDVLSTELATPGKMSWLNQDSNYKQSICEVIDFKNDRLSKLVKLLSADERYIPDPLTTGLHVAAREGRTKTVAALLSIGADIDAKDKAGSTAVELAKDTGTVEVLKTGGATMRPISNQNNLELEEARRKQACKYTAFFGKCNNEFCRKAKSDHYGADHRCLDPAEAAAAVWEAEVGTNQLLIEYAVKGLTGGVHMALQAGANVNHKDSAGNTAVELAKDTQTIEVLKAGGATMPKMSDQNKNQLLIKYAKRGCTGGVLMTLQVGANVNHKDSYSETALHGQPKGSKMWIGATALIYAAREGHLDMVQALLNAGANVDAKTLESETALHKAAWQGRLGIVQALLNAGANVDAKNWAGRTALSKAKFNNHAQVAALLRGRGRARVGFGRHSPP